ncbi:MAG: thiamine-phosphate kinase [Bacteroidales bacterium]|nr:thiamine-phosphate kinase [Bacteroidales bacterium]
MAEKKKLTEFSQIGRVAAIDSLFEESGFVNCPALPSADISIHKIMLEGVDFDLVYNPLKHLGYKAALNALGEVYASFHRPDALSVVLGISAKFSFESVKELWSGVLAAAREHSINHLQLDLNPSMTGLCISLTATGKLEKEIAEKRPQPQNMDLICLGGNVGAAYMGQLVLEREKVGYSAGSQKAQPDLKKYSYILSQYLCPELPSNVIDRFTEHDIIPSCGVFGTRGLADAIKTISRRSGFVAKIYVDRIPVSSNTFEVTEEINMDAMTAALNGGDDYRLLFTIPISQHDLFHKEIQTFDIIGHLCRPETGSLLVTPDGAELPIQSQGWQKD